MNQIKDTVTGEMRFSRKIQKPKNRKFTEQDAAEMWQRIKFRRKYLDGTGKLECVNPLILDKDNTFIGTTDISQTVYFKDMIG